MTEAAAAAVAPAGVSAGLGPLAAEVAPGPVLAGLAEAAVPRPGIRGVAPGRGPGA